MLIVTFIGNLGEAAIDENQAITTANGGVGETELTTLTPELIFDFNQVKKSYDAKEYSKAFKEAKALAVEGDADAQLYLGKMFADGRGTLQVSTAAHMWFNLAATNGNDEAFEERKAITASMTADSLEKAQMLATKCIQSKYQDCGLTVMPTSVLQVASPDWSTQYSKDLLKQAFKTEGMLKRKQIQYALKNLGYYTSNVDGLWGKGTSSALFAYAKADDVGPHSPGMLFTKILNQVTVPSSFTEIAKPRPAVKETQQANPTPAEKEPTVINLLFVLGKATVSINDALQNGDSPKSFSLQGTSLIGGSYSCTYECAGKLRTLRFYKYERCKPTLSCPLKSEEASYVGKSLEGKDHLCRN